MVTAIETPKGELILEELKKRQRAKEVVDVEEEKVKVVIFVCGEHRYAFYGSDIREILPSCEISWVPCLPGYIPGLINVRGDIESVIDLRHFLGEDVDRHGTNLIAMARRGEFHSGVMIEAIEDVVDIPLSALHPALATLNGAARDLVIGEIDFGDEAVPLLDIGKLADLIAL